MEEVYEKICCIIDKPFLIGAMTLVGAYQK
jgi:hypothetical protein